MTSRRRWRRRSRRGISDRPSINPSSRPPDAVFCASGAHVLERTLRSGSRKPRHAARPAELLDGLPRSRKPMTDMTTTATESSYKADALIADDIDAYLTQHQYKSLLRFLTCGRSEERRVGTECVLTGRSRWWQEHKKKNK